MLLFAKSKAITLTDSTFTHFLMAVVTTLFRTKSCCAIVGDPLRLTCCFAGIVFGNTVTQECIRGFFMFPEVKSESFVASRLSLRSPECAYQNVKQHATIAFLPPSRPLFYVGTSHGRCYTVDANILNFLFDFICIGISIFPFGAINGLTLLNFT